MSGKDTFTKAEADEIRALIRRRCRASRTEQKKIRDRMREIGFYGMADWGIFDCQPEDFERLISQELIKIKG